MRCSSLRSRDSVNEQPASPSAGGRGTETPTHTLCGPQTWALPPAPPLWGWGRAPRTAGEKQWRWGKISLKVMFQECSHTPF